MKKSLLCSDTVKSTAAAAHPRYVLPFNPTLENAPKGISGLKTQV